MDTHGDFMNYDRIMSTTVDESSKLEIELPEQIKHERLSDDENQIDVSTKQEVINITEFQAMALDYIIVHNNKANTESDNKSFNECSHEDKTEKVQSLTDGATSKLRGDNLCVVNDILTIFPFVCGICDEKIKCISIYLKHVSIHEKMNSCLLHCCRQDDTGIEERIVLFTCGICSIKFPTLCTLYKHLIESESVHDFVFKSSERTVYAYNENMCTENTGITKTILHNNRTRKKASYHLNHNTDVDTSIKRGNVKLSPSKLNDGSLHDSTNAEDVIENANNKGKKSKSRKKNTIRNHRTSGKSKKKNSRKEVDANYVLNTGNEIPKIKELTIGNPQTKTKRATSSLLETSLFASKEVHDCTDDNEDNVHVKEDVDDNIEDYVQVKNFEEHIENNVQVQEDFVYNTEDNIQAKEDVDDNIEDGVKVKEDCNTNGEDDEATCKQKVKKQLKMDVTSESLNLPGMTEGEDAGGRFRCEICHYSSNRKHNLARHLHLHRETLPDGPSTSTSKRHAASNAEEYICDQCAKVFKTKYGLNLHRRNHDGNFKHVCKKKDKIMRKDMKFPCEICGVAYHLRYMKRHKQTHDEPTLPCDQCDIVFNSKVSLYMHKKHVHTDEKMFICDQCGKRFKAWPYLKQHKKSHIKERIFQCSDCTMKFKTLATLKMHMRIHSDERPYSCDFCGLKLKRAGFLTNHKKCHSDEKPFSCPECGKSFKIKSEMKKHYGIHLPPKYFCSFCGKSFVQRYNMRIHMKVHGVKL